MSCWPSSVASRASASVTWTKRRVPAPLQFACHQAVVGIHAVILALRPLGLVAGFLYSQCQCLACQVVFCAEALGASTAAVTSGLDGVQDRGFDRPIDAEAADGETGGRATIDATP